MGRRGWGVTLMRSVKRERKYACFYVRISLFFFLRFFRYCMGYPTLARQGVGSARFFFFFVSQLYESDRCHLQSEVWRIEEPIWDIQKIPSNVASSLQGVHTYFTRSILLLFLFLYFL